MSLNKRVLISGYYGFDNSGDDAILKAIVKDIRNQDKKIDIMVLSNNPSKTESMYPVEAVHRFKLKEILKAMKEADLFISGGGSLLQDITSTRSLLYYLALMILGKIFRKPIMIYANGIGPIDKKINRFITKIVLNKVDLITLRDEDSKKYIEGIGVRNKNVIVTADPVFTLQATSREFVEDILKKEGVPRDKSLIGISIRQWKHSEQLVEVISKTIMEVVKKYDVNVLLIPMHYPEDLEISLQVKERINIEGCYVLKEKYSVEETMGIIKELDIIIAMRLHSLIYAATQKIPMVGLVYDPKVIGILNSLNMNYMCDVEKLNYNNLLENIDYVWNNREGLRQTLVEQEKLMEELALSNVAYVWKLLKVGI